MGGSERNVKWVEGLRGFASVSVVITHMSRAWDFSLFWPADEEHGAPRLWQLPILRVVFQGRIGVPIFAFLTGFVCAYKPLKLAYQHGNQPAALKAIARSAFRRPPRLVLPAVIATFISFLMNVLGFYKTSANCDAFWVRFDTPGQDLTFTAEVRRLFRSIMTTWMSTDNPYDRHQWAMRPLLIGAFQVYIVLAATIGMRFRYRILVHVLLMVYWWLNKSAYTETFGSCLTLGTLLAELSLHHGTQNFIAERKRLFTYIIAPTLIIVGLWMGSYPQEHEDWTSWSLWLHKTFVKPEGGGGTLVVPHEADPRRRMSSIAIQFCAIAVFLAPPLRNALSNRWLLWLGHHSFAVYLVHGTILRTIGMWIVFGPFSQLAVLRRQWAIDHPEDSAPKEDLFLPQKGRSRVYLGIFVFVTLTYSAAWLWMRYVDMACARATVWLEKRVFEEEEAGSAAEKGNGASRGSALKNGSANGLSSPKMVREVAPP